MTEFDRRADASGPKEREVTASAATRAAEVMQRLLIEGFRAATPLEGAAIVATLIAQYLATERNVVLFFPDRSRRRLEVATVGVSPELDRAVRRCVETLQNRSSFGRERAATSTEIAVVDEVDPACVRPHGVIKTLELCSYLSIPLMGPDGPTGRLICGSTRPRHWLVAESEQAMRLAMGGAAVIEAARRAEAERRARAELEYRASHDPMTGMWNREAFYGLLGEMLGAASPRELAVIVLDLDHFKPVNDTFGHHVGDELLSAASERITTCLRREDLCARLGGDEFAVALGSGRALHDGRLAAARIAAALHQPFRIGGATLSLAGSMGLAVAPTHGRDAVGLLQAADVAMYAAKRSQRVLVVYDDTLMSQPGVTEAPALRSR